MPSVSDLTLDIDKPGPVRVLFASGTAELNLAMLEQFALVRPDLPLLVVSEFEPVFPNGCSGEWIAWHVHRALDQNISYLKSALAGRRIECAAVGYDRRSALGKLRKAAGMLARGVLMAYDEDMRVAQPGELRGFLVRRAFRGIQSQLGSGGRVRSWLRRIVHPSEAEIPIRARLAQARGLAASRSRKTLTAGAVATAVPRGKPGVTIVIPSRDGLASASRDVAATYGAACGGRSDCCR